MKTYKMIVDIAKSYEGIKEGSVEHQQIVSDYNSILPHPRGYKLKETDAWCAAWLSVVMLRSGLTNFPFECGVSDMRQALYDRGNMIRGRLPRPGEILFYTYSHVGIVIGSNDADGLIITMEGNSNNMVRMNYGYFGDKNIKCFASPVTYTLTDICKQVIDGWWGDGNVRKQKLAKGGYDYAQVQAGVNRLLMEGTYGVGER